MSRLIPFEDGDEPLTFEEKKLFKEYMEEHPYIEEISSETGSCHVKKSTLRAWYKVKHLKDYY